MNVILIGEIEMEQKMDNNDIENEASKCNKYRINYNINKYHII